MGKPELRFLQGVWRSGEHPTRFCGCGVENLVETWRSESGVSLQPPAPAQSQVVINKCLSQD